MTPIWLQPQSSPPGCADPSASGAPACGAEPLCAAGFDAPRCEQPEIRGDAACVQRVLRALRQAGDLARGHNIVDAGHIRALRIDADEAVLALSFPAHCGVHQHIAEAAFQVLRRELPGRDLYVTHPR